MTERPKGARQDRPQRLPVLPGDRDEAPRSPEGPDEWSWLRDGLLALLWPGIDPTGPVWQSSVYDDVRARLDRCVAAVRAALPDPEGPEEAPDDDGLCRHGFPPEFCGNCHEEDEPEGPDEGLRECHEGLHCAREDHYDYKGLTYHHDAVLPLLTAERERCVIRLAREFEAEAEGSDGEWSRALRWAASRARRAALSATDPEAPNEP